jgi:hypothetical protein
VTGRKVGAGSGSVVEQVAWVQASCDGMGDGMYERQERMDEHGDV